MTVHCPQTDETVTARIAACTTLAQAKALRAQLVEERHLPSASNYLTLLDKIDELAVNEGVRG